MGGDYPATFITYAFIIGPRPKLSRMVLGTTFDFLVRISYDRTMRFAVALPLLTLIVGGCGNEVRQARQGLTSSDPLRRAHSAKQLGEAGDRVSVRKLIELLEDSMPDVRKASAKALGKIRDTTAVQPLTVMYEKEHYEDVADAGVRALIELGNTSVQPLLRLLRIGRPQVRAGAARALGKLEARIAVDPLIRALETDPHPDVRIAALFALRQIGDPRGLDAVAQAVKDEDMDVGAAAEKALSGRGYEKQMDEVRRALRLGR